MSIPDREITAPVPLLTRWGLQNPAAIGWSRTPMIDTDRVGSGPLGWGRTKRWEYWAVVTPTHIIALTIGALDYANIRQVWVLDRTTHEEIDAFEVSPFSSGVDLPGSLDRSSARSIGRRVSIEFSPTDEGTLLIARAPRVRVEIMAARLPDHEAMGTAAPFSPFLAEFTVKDVDRPASGTVQIDGRLHDVPAGRSWAVLDHLRGRLHYRTHWNWGAGAGRSSGHRIGLQLGGGGPQAIRHGVSQNAFTVDGRVHKVAEPLEWDFDTGDWWAPWRVHNERMELTLTPEHVREGRTNFVVVFNEAHQCFGDFTGRVCTDDGTWLDITGITGWVEDVTSRW